MSKALSVFALIVASSWCVAQTNLNYFPIDETDKTPPAELRARRTQVKELIGEGNIAVIYTNPTRNRNNDVDFLFRGDSNFLYLTGFEEPDASLMLVPSGITVDGRKATEILFVNEADQGSITWLGYRMGPGNSEKMLGVEMALPNKRFKEVLALALKPGVKLSVNSVPAPSGLVKAMADMVATAREEGKNESGPRLERTLSTMRGIKSAFEIGLLKKACQFSALGHVEAMKAMKPGMREWEISALVQYVFGKFGCEYSGYPPICGSGPNSTILHYEANRRLMKAGDIYCMDSAGEYHGYSADVTRTFPVSGKFSGPQRAIYQVVYDAQEVGIKMCKAGMSVQRISEEISNTLAIGLTKLGLIKDMRELGRYYMHGFGHGIGLDVHDPMPRTLVPGVCLTVEPGIYIKEGSPCDKKWWNIGVRIEDDVLVTATGPVNMSAAAPRKWQDIEKLMATKK